MNTYLSFTLHNQHFAVPVSNVLEVLQTQHITPVPKMPSHVRGIIHFRGNILPVLDMHRRLHITTQKQHEVVIVFELNTNNADSVIAATADTVSDVISFASSDIIEVPELGLNYNSEYISGAVKIENTFMLLINIQKVLTITS